MNAYEAIKAEQAKIVAEFEATKHFYEDEISTLEFTGAIYMPGETVWFEVKGGSEATLWVSYGKMFRGECLAWAMDKDEIEG